MPDRLTAEGGICAPAAPTYQLSPPRVIPDTVEGLVELWLQELDDTWKAIERMPKGKARRAAKAAAREKRRLTSDLQLCIRGGGSFSPLELALPVIFLDRGPIRFIHLPGGGS